MRESKTWFLYMIECQDNSIYTGITVDVARRYVMHAKGKGARYTKSHPPKKLLAVVAYPNRSLALKAEIAVKKLSPTTKRKFAAQLFASELGARAAPELNFHLSPCGRGEK